MKKKITLITSILLILALAVTFVGCDKDKTEETPTTTEKVSTTEPTTKFEVPEIKDEPTTEETTEETEASAPETTTKKSTYTGSSNSGSSSSNYNSKPASKPASTTKAATTTKAPASNGGWVSTGKDENGNDTFTNGDGFVLRVEGDNVPDGGHGSADDWEPDPEMDGWGEGGMLE